MKALSLTQPWASLIALGVKTIETRSWSTKYRGPLAVHATASIPSSLLPLTIGDYRVEKDNPRGSPPAYMLRSPNLSWPYRLPTSAIVATCTLVDVVATYGPQTAADLLGGSIDDPYGDYSPGRFAWVLADIEPIRQPRCGVKGHQGLWEWDEAA